MRKGQLKKLIQCKVNNLDFLTIDSKVKAYTFGLLNADGYITGSVNTLVMYTVTEDMNEFKIKLSECLPFTYYDRQLKGNRKLQTGAYVYSSHLFDKLKEINFNDKSKKFVRYDIPSELIKYYLLGYFDGDGCFYVKQTINKDGSPGSRSCQFNVCASYDFDWSWLEEILTENGITYNKVRYQYTKSGFSRIIVSRLVELEKLIKFLYSDSEFKSLKRKYDKAMIILNYIKSKSSDEMA